MTYCEEIGLKVGDKIKYLGRGSCSGLGAFQVGEVLTFTRDDESRTPYFCNEYGLERAFNVAEREWEKVPPNKDYVIGVGSYILKEDIPDEATHNKVLEVFKKCGYSQVDGCGTWGKRGAWGSLVISSNGVSWSSYRPESKYRLTLEQILNYFDEEETMHKKDDIVSVEMTKEELLLINAVLGAGNTSIISGAFCRIAGQVQDIFEADDLPSMPLELINVCPHQKEWEEEIEEFFNPKPTEKQLRQEKIKELESKLKELKDLDN